MFRALPRPHSNLTQTLVSEGSIYSRFKRSVSGEPIPQIGSMWTLGVVVCALYRCCRSCLNTKPPRQEGSGWPARLCLQM